MTITQRKLFFALTFAGTTLSACATPQVGRDTPSRGMVTVNQPVISRTDYIIDVPAPSYDGIAARDASRLRAWFQSLQLRYGDRVYVDDPQGNDPARRGAIASVVSSYGLFVNEGAPITEGAIADGNVRVIVSRSEAYVPGCPNWSRPSNPNFDQAHDSNFGCATNSNLAAMVANPEDLVNGRELGGPSDPAESVKSLSTYRKRIPTGTGALKSESGGK